MSLNHEAEHYCPVYMRVIDPDLCYDSLMCLLGFFKVSSTRELQEVKNIELARRLCEDCSYSNLE